MTAVMACVFVMGLMSEAGAQTLHSTTGEWILNANGNWSTTSAWANLDPTTDYPSGQDAIANLGTLNITATRIITLNVPVTLGTLIIGDTTGNNSYTIQSGTLTFDSSTGFALLEKVDGGANDTISSAIAIASGTQLDVTVKDTSNSQGIVLSGVISGGTNGSVTMTFEDLSAETPTNGSLNYLYLSGANTFEGRLEIKSGLLRLEGNNAAAGAVGVGNETIVLSGGGVDLRGRALNLKSEDTEIFKIAGIGPNGLGALRNTTGTAYLSHLALTSSALMYFQSTTVLERHQDAAGTAGVASILDFGGPGNNLTKIGPSDFIVRGADVLNANGASLTINEGEVRFESRGLLSGSGASTGINLDGLTVNIAYNRNPYDNVDPANGSRTTTDAFSVNINQSATQGNTVNDARFSMASYWGASVANTGTLAEQAKETLTFDGMTFNFNNGVFQREGNSDTGRTFDHIFTNVTVNIVGAGIGRNATGNGNLFDIQSGSANYNSTTGAYDHPGSTIFQGSFVGAADTGFTVRGSRELRVEGASTGFLGDILIKQATGRNLPAGFNTTNGAIEAQYASFVLSGANGSFTSANSITLERYGNIWLDNQAANNNDRLKDTGMLNFRDGHVILTTNAAVENTENLGNLNSQVGTNKIFIDSRPGGRADITINSLNISAGSVLNFENVNSGSDWGIGLTDDRIALTNTASVTTSGNLAPTATTDRAVILGAFGGDVPTPGAYTVAQRPAFAVENGYARSGAADRFLTLDGGFIRPLLDSEYDTSAADPGTGTNWKVITEIGNTGLRTNLPNVTSNLTINSLVISNASVPTAAKEYVIIDNLATLTINSGMINFSNFAQTTSANMESVISGGRIDMNGQQAIVNSSSFFEDLDRNDANYYSYITGYNSFMRSSITNANGLVKTGRNNLYLDTFNEFIPGSTLYVTDEASVIVRHSLALQGIDEVYVTGAGNFLLQTGVNIVGTNLRVGSQDTSRVVLRSETNGHNTWAGNVILDNIDTAGSKEFTQPVIGALNDATLTVYGNISTSVAANAAAIDSDSFDDPFILSTSTGQSGTLNLRGQVRDLPTGTFANPVYRYGDSATNTDTNHSLSFNMTGHDENNVNVFQQWNATGRLNLARGFFRVMYDPNAPGNDGIGFLTDTANALILRNDYWTRTALGVDGASTGTYDSHLMLTKAGQVYNWANQISIYNNNRDGTINIGGENESGSVYIGSDDGVNYSIVFENQGGDRDVRFLQTRGGTLVINARLVDNGTSVNSIANVTGPGTIIFNANGAGASTVERWNFMGGDVFWQANPANDSLLGNDRFGIAAAQAMFGGGSLTYNAGSAASRTENLTGNFRLLSGESEINVISYTGLTDTLNFGAAAATFAKNQGGTMRFIEAGDGTAVITLQATGLTGTGLMSYATYGTAVGVVTDFASNDAGGQISAFSGYVAGSAEADFTGGNTVDVTVDVAFTGAATPDNLRFDAPVALTLDTQAMTLGGGAILITSANSGVNSISGGTLTSSFDADLGGAGTRTDLMIQNYGSGTLTLGATLTDNGGDKMNLVLGGQGTTVLTGTNTMTGEIYLNNGVLSISSESNLGVIDGSIATLARVNIGGSNGASLTGAPLIFSTGGVDGGAAGTFNTNSSQQVTATTLTSGGSGYTSGVYVTNAAAGSAGIWAVLDSGNLHFDGGTLAVTQDVTLDGARTLFLGSNGGFLDVTSGKTLTINGYLTSEFSHINAANGFTANHTGGTDAPAMDGNPDIGDLIIQGGGTVVLTGAPNNSLQSNMFNSYGGITWINEGSLKLASYGSTATGILGSNRSWIDGTIIGANGTLELSMTSDNTMYEWITFRGRGYEGRGTILTTGNTSTRYHRLSGQMFIESDILINITDTSTVRFNENGGTFYGTGDIYRKGVGEFQFYGNAPEWEGAYIAGSGNTRLYGDANFTGLTGITLDRNTYFGFNASSNDRNMFDDRMPDTTPIYGYSYAKLRMEGTSAVHSGRARVGIATAATGVFGIEYDLASIVTGGAVEQGLTSAGWRFAELVRNEGAVFQFRNLDPGTDFARGATFGITDFDNRAILTVDTAPAVVGIGNGLDGNTPIIPGFFGGTRPEFLGYTTGIYLDEDRTSRFLMTVEAGTDAIYGGAVNYLRPLSDAPGSTDYKIIADPGNNTASVTVDLALAGTTADQNLRFVGLTTDAIGSGNGLTSLVNSSLTLDTTLIANSVSFGADVVGENTNGSGNRVNLDMGQNGTLQINSGVLMFANIGTMDRLGSSYNTGVNLDMTNFITGGRMDFNGKEAIIYAGNQWAQYNISGSNLNYYNNTDADGTAAYLRTNIVNTGGHGLTKTGASSVLLERANNYTGNTNITMGYLYARHDLAFGQSTRVNLTGTGGLILGNSSQIMGVDLYIGAISGNNLTLYTEGEGNEWGGNVIIDNVDATGTAGGSQRNFVPRIQVASSNTVFHIDGDIYGGDTPVALGAQGTAARIFTTYTTATSSVLDILGQVKDKSSGAIAAGSNMNEALRMEVVGTNDLATVHLYSQYDSAGRINLVRGVLRYMGDGNFYTDAAALALDPNNEMSGLQMGGRSLLTGDGVDTADVSLFLNKAGTAFNLSSWKVGVDVADPANFFASGNYGLGNTTGNSTIGGENNSGTITFGTGTGSILFTQADAAYDRNLNLYSTRGGEVDMKVNFVDGGNLVSTSITKVGAGTVNLLGSSAGDSTVEALKMLGGTLVMQGYDVNANRRIGNGAALTLSGGYLIVDANSATGPVVEDFSDLTLNSGGSRLAVRGNAIVSIISTASLVPASGVTMAFVENNGGVINLSATGMTTTDGERFGWWAVYGNVLGQVTDWAAREGTTGVKAFTNYAVNTFGSGNNTSVTTGTTLGGNTATGSLQVAAASALDLGGNTLTVENGGILISAAVGGPVSITNGTLTRSGAGDILLHNYGATTIAAAITNDGANAVNLVTGGVGTLTLTGANTYTGDTFVNGGTLEISSESQLGDINGSIYRLVREYNGTNNGASKTADPLFFITANAPTAAATGTFATNSSQNITSTTLTDGGAGYTTGVYVNKASNGTGNAGIWAILDSGNLHLDGGTLGVKDNVTLDGARTIFLGASGGTFAVDPGKVLTINGYVTSDVNNVDPNNDLPIDITRPYVGGLTVEGGGTVVLTGAPNNVVQDYMYNGYNSTTSVLNGTLQLSGLATSAQNAMGTSGGWADGTYIGPNGTLRFSTASDTVLIYEWLTLDGQGYQNNGTIQSSGIGRSYYLRGQVNVLSDAVINMRIGGNLYLNNGGGETFGSGDIIKVGNGIFRFYTNIPNWTGDYISASGTTNFYGAGRATSMGSMRLDRNTYLGFSATSTSRDEFVNRLRSDMHVYTDGYIRMRLEASGTVISGITGGGIADVTAGVLGIEYDLGTTNVDGAPVLGGDYAGWHFTDILRSPGAAVQVRNLDAGTDISGGVTDLINRAVLLVDNTASVLTTLVGGDGSSLNHQILPGFFGGSRPANFINTTTGTIWDEDRTSRFLMTAVAGTEPTTGAAVSYLRPLAESDYKIISDPGTIAGSVTVDLATAGIAADQNVRLVGLTDDAIGAGNGFTTNVQSILTLGTTADATVTVNSLTFAADTNSYNNTGTNNNAGNEVHLQMGIGGKVAINSGVLMFANMGTMDRGGAGQNTGINLGMNNYITGGTLDFSGKEAIIYTGSEWAQYNTSDQVNAYRNTDVDNTYTFLRTNITNTGGNGLTKTGASNLYIDGGNSFTGNTSVTMGNLYARHDFALGNPDNTGPNTRMNVTGSGNFILGNDAKIMGVDLYVGKLNGSNLALYAEATNAQWGGNVIIDNVDAAGTAGAWSRTFVPRIEIASSNGVFIIDGNIMGGDTPVAAGGPNLESRIFTTYTGAVQSVLDFRGSIMDNSMGAIAAPVTAANQNQVLRMEVSATNDLATVHLYDQYDSAGRIQLVRGVLRYMGGGNFYTDAAAAALNPDNAMSGLQMGGRSLIDSSVGIGSQDVAFFLNQAGSTFNLSSWNVGVDIADPDNFSNNSNYGLGNTTGNSSIGGENTSGTITFGTGTGSIRFTQADAAYDRNLNIYAARGGEVDMKVNFVDGGSLVNTSITKVGAGTVNLLGSSAGDSTVEALKMLGGTLVMQGYDVNANRRIGNGAALTLSGGYLIVDANSATGPVVEDFSDLTLNSGGSRLAVRGTATVSIISTASLVPASGVTMAFVENNGGVINLSAPGMTTTDGERFGWWAVYGNVLGQVTDWAAREGTTGVKAFTNYDVNTFGSGNNTSVTTGTTLGGNTATGSLQVAAASALDLGGNTLTVENGGILISAAVGGPVSITNGTLTRSGAGDILLHNYGVTTIAAAITNDGANAVNLVTGGVGTLTLTGANTYTGDTFVNGGTLEISSESALGQINGSIVRLVREYNGTNGSGSNLTFSTTVAPTTAATGTFAGGSAATSTNLTGGGSGYSTGIHVNARPDNTSNAGIWAILDSGNLHLDGGTLGVKDDITLDGARTIFLGASGGTLTVDAGKTLTINGYITSDVTDVPPPPFDSPIELTRPFIGGLAVEGGGTVVLTGAPDNTSREYMFNGYNALTSINEGAIKIAGLASSATNALGTYSGWNDSTYIGPNGSLLLNVTNADIGLYEWLTLDGQGYQGGGTIQAFNGTSSVRSHYLRGQINVLQDAVFNLRNGSNIYLQNGGGEVIGSGDIIKIGNGDFRFYGNSPYWTGGFVLASGSSRMYDGSAMQGMASMTLQRNGYFAINADSTTSDELRNRLDDDLLVFTDGYIRMRIEAYSSVFSGIEKVGTATVLGGQLGLEFDLGSTIAGGTPVLGGDYAGWHFTEIVRSPGTTVQLRSLDVGTSFADSTFATDAATGADRAVVMVDVLPTLIGTGDGTNGNAKIAPGFFGGVRPDWINSAGTGTVFNEDYIANRLVTVDTNLAGDNFLRPLLDSEYKVVSNPDTAQTTTIALEQQGITADQNVKIVGVITDTGIGAGEFTDRRNSILTLGTGNGVCAPATGNDLTINSLTFESTSYVSGAGSGRGNYTALMLGDGAVLTINSGVIQLYNTGIQNRNGAAYDANTNMDIRSAILGGSVNFAGQEAIFNIGGIWAHYNTSDAASAYRATDFDSNYLFMNSSIVNGTGLTKTGGASLFLNAPNYYSGPTSVNQGYLYARHDNALGTSTQVNVTGAGSFAVGLGARITDVDLYVGKLNGINLALQIENNSVWAGNVIIDNVDSGGATAYVRSFVPRIFNNQTGVGTIEGNIYGGSTTIGSGALTESRMFSTYTGAFGLLDIRGQVRDTATGAITGPVDIFNQSQVLRMEVTATNNESAVQLGQQYDAAGRINLIRGALYYAGSGDFYTTAAAATANSAPLNPMIGLQMGGRSVTSDNGRGAANLAFFLLNGGQNFNLKSWQVGVDINDPDNTAANYTYGEGNTTGNSTLGGVNTSGTVTFGTGAGSIIFTQATTSYSRDLGLFAARGGEVDFKVNFVDGGNLVTSSVTKLGAGQVNLLGSTAGDSTVEGVNVMGGILAMGGYNTNLNRRVGNGAGLTLAGGTLVMDGSGASFTENFGTLKVNQGGNAIAAAGNGTTNFGTVSILAASITRAAGGTLHFQSIAGGTIHFSNAAMQNVARIGSYATFGANFAFTPAATDWAATDAAGNVMAYTGYGVDAFGAATQTDVQGAGLTAATTNSVRFNDAAGTITGGTLTLNDGGILITSNYTTGTPVGAGVGVTTSATGTDLLIHNFATGVVSFDGDISGAQNVVFGGAGTLSLGGTNIYTGATHVTGSATVAFDDVTRFGSTSGIFLNGGTLQYSAVASTSAALTQNITLGGGNGTLSVADADSRLVIRGLATNQISSEANNIISAYGTNNPNAGGLQILGPGTVQFGDRSATTQDLLGVVNNYTGLTVLGDGVAALRVDIQGMGNNNDQYAPFGTTESWADATIVRNNVTIEFSHKRTAQTAQIRFREWFQIGEQAGDQILFDGSTQRQPTLDGILNIIGDLTFETQGNRYADAGSTGNSEFLINPNEGGVMGGGDIIKKGDGNLRFYKPLHEWTGDLRIEDGFLGMQMNSGNMFNATGKIYFGDPTGTQTSLVRLRIENLYYSNNTIGLDSPKIDLTVNRDIIVNDDIKQQVQISAGYQPASATIHFTGNINVGNGSNNSVDFYYEDNNNLDPAIVGHVQQTVFDISGNLSGSNPIYLDSNNNGGNAKDATFAVVFSGDNSGYSGLLTIGKDTGATDNPLRGVTLRIGDVTDLGTNSTLRFRNYGILQLAGNSMTLSQDLVFTGNASRAVSAGIENGSSAAATVTFDSGTQTGSNYQDVSVGLRDGVAASVFGGGNAALSVIKVGSGDTVLGRNTGGTTPDEFSRYTGTTSVQEGILYAGSNNVFSPYSRFILADGATLSPYWDNVSTGYTVSIGSLSGTAGAAVNITKSTLNVGGDDTSGANFAGVISGSGAGTNLNKVGAGSQELSGANTFTGGVAVNQGTLIGSSDSAFGDAANAINLGGVVDARVELLLGGTAAVLANPVLMNSSGGNDQGITLIGTRETSGTYGFSSTVGLYQNVATNVFVEAQGTSVFQFGAAVQDAGAGVMPLIKIGSGTVELQAANTYGSGGTWSAGTAIDGGTLIRNGTLSVFDSAALSTTVVELGDTRVTLALSADLATNRSLITPDGGGTFDAASDGAGGAGNGAFLNVKAEVDGVLLTVADIGKRILVKDEGNDPERNGVFVVVSFDDTCGQMNLVRATDFDEASEMRYGTGIAVSGGTQAGNQFFMAAADVAAVNGDGTDPVYWLADVENPHVGLLAGAAGLTVMNDIDINDTNGTGSTILGGTFTTGTTEFQGAVTLQNNATPGVDNQRELIFTSASNDAGGGVLITGAVTQDNETILSVTKQGAGTVTLANGLTNYTGKTTISEGTLALTGAGTIATSSWIDIASGATFESSTGAGDFTFDGPISGAGTVKTGTGSLIVGTTSGAGVLKPGVTSDPSAIGTAGDQVGTLTVTGNVVLTGSTGGADRLTLQMGSTSGADYNDETNIYNHLGAGDYATWVQTQEGLYNSQTMGNHDRLNVSGSVTLNAGGTIRFTRGGLDYQPVLGDVFNLIDWATINPNGFDVGNGGAFRSGGLLGDLELPDLGLSGLQYDTSLFTSSGIVVVVPEPGRIVLLMAGLLGLFLRRRRPDIC